MVLGSYDKSLEEKWSKYWVENEIFKFTPNHSGELYSIDTPPPFTSGKLHIGHVLSYCLFDFAARYRRMKGYNVLFIQGFDTQGFPTEVKVEKKYGRLPREEFVSKCVEWTHEFIDTMKGQMQRIGHSADWSKMYITMSPEYHKKVQFSLIEMYKNNLVYKASHPVFWCPSCVSAIAKAETEDLERNTKLNHLKFKLSTGNELIIATTRPEYLHACVAVLVHPADERYNELVGTEVETPLGKKVKIYSDVDVDKEFGTGAVMVCTFGDKQDSVWVYRHNLDIIEAIDKYGKLINAGEFDGLKTEVAKEKIMEKLKSEDKVVKVEDLKQTIKIHDRCKKPIELKISDQWFCKLDGFQNDIKKTADEMKWIPEYTKQYLVDWTNFVEWDWVISRQRHFGTPLPFYNCPKCSKTQAAGGDELPFKPENKKEHKCECGEVMEPEMSVADCWIDSSITPLIITGWPEPGWEKFYPISLRPQGIEIIRTWAFYTIYRTLVLTGKAPFKELLLNGNVLGPNNKKMSKSLGNVVDPAELTDKYSVDSIRLWTTLSGNVARDRPFKFQEMQHAQSFINKIWNASRFVETSCEGFKISENEKYKLEMSDKWILSKLQKLIEKCDKSYMDYDYFTVTSSLQSFFWNDFCDNYLELVKHRIYGENEESKKAAQYTLHTVLENSIKLMAPIISFVSEEIHNKMYNENESVHLQQFPVSKKELIDEHSEKVGDLLCEIMSHVRKHKSTNRISLKEEIDKMKISIPRDKIILIEALRNDVEQVGHIKHLEFIEGEGLGVIN